MKKSFFWICAVITMIALGTVICTGIKSVKADEEESLFIEWKVNDACDNAALPGHDEFNEVANAQHYRSSTSKTYNLTIYDGSTTVTRATQTTDWSYSGSASSLTGHNMMFQNILGGYAIKSGGHTTVTNSNGSQQITDYFKFINASGAESYWYYIETKCSVGGTVTVTTGQLSY